MGNIEQEQSPKAEKRIIRLGDEFHPFDPKYTKSFTSQSRNIMRGGVSIEEFDSGQIVLDIGNKHQVHFSLTAIHGLPTMEYSYAHGGYVLYGGVQEYNVLTPFDPKSGYQINGSDFNIADRLDKVRAMSGKTREGRLYRKTDFPLKLHADAVTKYPNRLPPNMVFALKMQIFFGEESFEASLAPTVTSRGNEITFGFDVFYPTSKGTLSTPRNPFDDPAEYTLENLRLGLRKGLYVFLPSDLEKLTQIRAKLVLDQQKPQEV